MTTAGGSDCRPHKRRDMQFYTTFPNLSTDDISDDIMAGNTSPNRIGDGHSRDSSVTSSASSPNTPTFSTRSHNRVPSSTSSLASTPDSPVNVAKSPLHDLVEEPAEMEDHIGGNASKQAIAFDLTGGEVSDDPRDSIGSRYDWEDGPFGMPLEPEGPLCICE